MMLLIFWSCSRSKDTPSIEIANHPIAALLIFPEDNTECNEGIVINDNQSSVNFQWNESEFTDDYTVVLKNLNTDTTFETESTTNSVVIIIERSTPYQWFVISKSENSDKTAESDSWQFFNAGKGTTNYAPFPADIISPQNDQEISPIDGKILLEWTATDIDNDIKEYEVFFGLENTSTESMGIVNKNTFEVNVIAGTEYFWKIKTQDEAGNISTSDIFNFLVN